MHSGAALRQTEAERSRVRHYRASGNGLTRQKIIKSPHALLQEPIYHGKRGEDIKNRASKAGRAGKAEISTTEHNTGRRLAAGIDWSIGANIHRLTARRPINLEPAGRQRRGLVVGLGR